MAKSSTAGIIDTVEEWFGKLPALPKEAREVIAKITPWIALIFGILGILGSIAALGIVTVFSPLAMVGGGVQAAGAGIIATVLGLVSSALLLAAFPGTKKFRLSGWNFLFYSETVSLLSAVLAISITGILVSLIGYYLLFQIKSQYK
ncbi:MAG: hypothetical protein ACHQT7_01050 [Candidatus Levyibacteriota bacterium]